MKKEILLLIFFVIVNFAIVQTVFAESKVAWKTVVSLPNQIPFNKWDRNLDFNNCFKDKDCIPVCSSESMCLVSEIGNADSSNALDWFRYNDNDRSKPRCINSGGYVLDYYCGPTKLNAGWTTRTKLLFLSLYNKGCENSNECTVQCGSYDEVLTNTKYPVEDYDIVRDYLEKDCYIENNPFPCVNNFCILKSGDVSAFGTGVNVPISDEKNSFLKTLNLQTDFCKNVKLGSGLQLCGSFDNKKLYYNPDLQLVVVATREIAPVNNFLDLHLRIIYNLFDPLWNYAKQFKKGGSVLFKNIETASLFNNVYYSKKGSKEIFAFKDLDQTTDKEDYIAVYTKNLGFKKDDCLKIFRSRSELSNEKDYSSVVCDAQEGDIFHIVEKRKNLKLLTVLDNWIDLTGKLRLE